MPETPALPVELAIILRWVIDERAYQLTKFTPEDDDAHVAEGFGDDTWLWQQLTNYIGRVRLHGFDSDNGRQAYMKILTTLVGLGEAMIRKYGEPPPAGHPSGPVDA